MKKTCPNCEEEEMVWQDEEFGVFYYCQLCGFAVAHNYKWGKE